MPILVEEQEFTIEVSEVKVPEERQRRDQGDIESLAKSISRVGQIYPIIIDRNNVLVAGGRRLAAKKLLQHHHIQAKYLDECDPTERELIELEENFKRKQLEWREECLGVLRVHDLSQGSTSSTSSLLGISEPTVNKYVQVGRLLRQGNKEIESCATLSAAYNVLERMFQRQVDSEMDDLEVGLSAFEIPIGAHQADEAILEAYGTVDPRPREPERKVRAASKDVLHVDFCEWIKSYNGPRFNFIHCDFPYGISHDRSDQGGAARHGAYEDSEETYTRLLSILLEYKDILIADAAHLMFWFSMNYYQYTVNQFKNAGFNVEPFPLIWYKSDNTGILPDSNRGPRRVYETALLISRGDRKIVRAVSNLVSWPASKASAKHLSEKPNEVLAQFFRMLVDSSTTMLDPTCGCGNALVEAERLQAGRVLGLEIDEDYCLRSRGQLNAYRNAPVTREPEEEDDISLNELLDGLTEDDYEG